MLVHHHYITRQHLEYHYYLHRLFSCPFRLVSILLFSHFDVRGSIALIRTMPRCKMYDAVYLTFSASVLYSITNYFCLHVQQGLVYQVGSTPRRSNLRHEYRYQEPPFFVDLQWYELWHSLWTQSHYHNFIGDIQPRRLGSLVWMWRRKRKAGCCDDRLGKTQSSGSQLGTFCFLGIDLCICLAWVCWNRLSGRVIVFQGVTSVAWN